MFLDILVNVFFILAATVAILGLASVAAILGLFLYAVVRVIASRAR